MRAGYFEGRREGKRGLLDVAAVLTLLGVGAG